MSTYANQTRAYDDAAKFVESVTTDFSNHAGVARGMINEVTSFKAILEASGTVTARLMHFETMTISQVQDAKIADFRELAATVK